MKKITSIILALTLVVTMMLGLSVNASAAGGKEAAIIFTGKDFAFKPSPDEDLFQNFKDLLPGDVRTQNITISNRSDKPTDFYLEIGASAQDEMTEAEEALVWELIYNYVEITITDINGEVIYSGVVGGEDRQSYVDKEITDGAFFLGEVAANTDEEIVVNLTLSPDLENPFQHLAGHVWWFIRIEQDDEDIIIEIEDETPLVDLPIIGEVPLPQLPSIDIEDFTPLTGDATIILLWAVIVIAAPVALIVIRKRRKQSQAEN